MQRRVHSTPDAPAAIGPYSQSIRAEGPILFISGQIPLNPNGELVTGDIKDQTRQSLENLRAILDSAGLSLTHVCKTTVFLKSMDDFPAMNEVYATYFPFEPPARSTIAVAGLPKNVDVEIEAVAIG